MTLHPPPEAAPPPETSEDIKYGDLIQGYEHGAILAAVGVCVILQLGYYGLHLLVAETSPRYGWAGFILSAATLAASVPLLYWSRSAIIAGRLSSFRRRLATQNTVQILWLLSLTWLVHPICAVLTAFALSVALLNDLRYLYDSRLCSAIYAAPLLSFIAGLLVFEEGPEARTAIVLATATLLIAQTTIRVVGPQFRAHDARLVELTRARQDVQLAQQERELFRRYTSVLSAGLSSSRFAHDVRSPLTAISINLELLKEATEDLPEGARDELRETTVDLERASQSLLDLTMGLAKELRGMDEAGAESAHGLINKAWADAATRLALDGLEHEAPEVDLEPAYLVVDSGHVATLGNLIINAIRHGSRRITIDGSMLAGERYVVRIRDFGADGAAREEALRRIHASMSMQSGSGFSAETGYGLALSLARLQILRHGGDLRARPAPDGPGIVLEIELEVVTAPVDQPARENNTWRTVI